MPTLEGSKDIANQSERAVFIASFKERGWAKPEHEEFFGAVFDLNKKLKPLGLGINDDVMNSLKDMTYNGKDERSLSDAIRNLRLYGLALEIAAEKYKAMQGQTDELLSQIDGVAVTRLALEEEVTTDLQAVREEKARQKAAEEEKARQKAAEEEKARKEAKEQENARLADREAFVGEMKSRGWTRPEHLEFFGDAADLNKALLQQGYNSFANVVKVLLDGEYSETDAQKIKKNIDNAKFINFYLDYRKEDFEKYNDDIKNALTKLKEDGLHLNQSLQSMLGQKTQAEEDRKSVV